MKALNAIKTNLGMITILVFIGITGLYLIPKTLPSIQNQPQNGIGNCANGWVSKVEQPPFTYNGAQTIVKVIVKAGSDNQDDGACTGFVYPPANQSNGCYQVNGLGSTSVRVTKIGSGDDCKDISHVEFYAGIINTPTSTPTEPDTPTPTNTQTPTNTPTEPDTPTPTAPQVTRTPGITPTPTDPQVTQTPGITPTPTDPPKQKTGTPMLPNTGFWDDHSSGGLQMYFGIGFGLILVVILARFLRKRVV